MSAIAENAMSGVGAEFLAVCAMATVAAERVFTKFGKGFGEC